jgi:hypothetical protein
MNARSGWLSGGLFLVALATLMLEHADVPSAALAASAVAAAGVWCFARWAGRRGLGSLLVAGLLVAAFANARADARLGIVYPKSRAIWFTPDVVEYSAWNAHSNVVIRRPVREPAFLWGPASDAVRPRRRASVRGAGPAAVPARRRAAGLGELRR